MMDRRKLGGAVDESSAKQQNHKSETNVHILGKI